MHIIHSCNFWHTVMFRSMLLCTRRKGAAALPFTHLLIGQLMKDGVWSSCSFIVWCEKKNSHMAVVTQIWLRKVGNKNNQTFKQVGTIVSCGRLYVLFVCIQNLLQMFYMFTICCVLLMFVVIVVVSVCDFSQSWCLDRSRALLWPSESSKQTKTNLIYLKPWTLGSPYTCLQVGVIWVTLQVSVFPKHRQPCCMH